MATVDFKRQILPVIILISLALAAMAMLNLNNRYLNLLEEYESQNQELSETQSLLLEAEKALEQYNITLETLESNPIVKATSMIISQVGIDYFKTFFHDPHISTPKWNHNVTLVTYKYDIITENNTIEQDVMFYFYPRFTQTIGVPIKENLQPFNVTSEEAKKYAILAGLPDGPYELDAFIQYIGVGDVYPLTGDEEKYVWRIVSWLDPPWFNPRKRQSSHVDPISGKVYGIWDGGRTVQESHVDTSEKALAYGVEGYVRLNYSEIPQRIIVSSLENYSFTIQASFVSYVDGLNEVNVTVDPYNNETTWIQRDSADALRDYLVYEPSGKFLLKAGDYLNITCTITVPETENLLEINRYTLHGLGISAENILIVHNLNT